LVISLGGGIFLTLYGIATVAGAPDRLLSPVFAVVMLPVPAAAWWAYRRADAALRRAVLLLAWAASCWLIGSLVWQLVYETDSDRVPRTPGIWDPFFVAALLLVIAALVVAMRSVISVRLAALDATVICAAGVSLAALFVHRGLHNGVSIASLVPLYRPLLSTVVLMLIVSAALGSSEGLPRSMLMLGVTAFALMVGNLIYSYRAIQDSYVDDRWANLAWATGAIAAILMASVLILGIDRPLRLPTQPMIPSHAAGSRPVLLGSLLMLTLSLGVAWDGLRINNHAVALTGLGACGIIAIAMALRARDSIRTAEGAYRRLDRTLADAERAKDGLLLANRDLSHANAEIRALHIAYADLLNLTDERTQGRIRALIEDTGGILAKVLTDELERHSRS
jgi:hypothetical protein